MAVISMVSIKKTLIDTIGKFILPRSGEQDKARREFILNILLAAIVLFLSIGIALHVVIWEIPHIVGSSVYGNDVISLSTLLLIFLFFIILFLLSRRGFFFVVSYIFIFALLVLAVYSSYTWGVDANASLLFYVLIIVMSGILVGTRFSFLILGLSSLLIFVLGFYQINHIVSPKLYWKSQGLNMASVVMYVAILFVIATVSWLSNREIEKSLARARKSEAELKKERDSLEIKVEERTRELREIQAEKMIQLYRFAEFGRLSSGLFHDLINPLNAVVLNMEAVRSRETDGYIIIDETRTCMDSAISAARKMEDMVIAVRKQISKQKNEEIFSVVEEARQVINVLMHRARQAGIEIVLSCPSDVQTFGDTIKFNQVVLNLVNNAIDAYSFTVADQSRGLREIGVSLSEENGRIFLSVRDYGMGIPKENLNKIFKPFFTTKGPAGMGVGLSMVKRIIEKNFDGEIAVESEQGRGTVFIISFQKKYHEK